MLPENGASAYLNGIRHQLGLGFVQKHVVNCAQFDYAQISATLKSALRSIQHYA